MGPFEIDILEYVKAQPDEACSLHGVLSYLSSKPDFMTDWAMNDVKNLIRDGLLSYNEETEVLTLLPKAKKPVVKMPPNDHS